jgi:hypothetical protein
VSFVRDDGQFTPLEPVYDFCVVPVAAGIMNRLLG